MTPFLTTGRGSGGGSTQAWLAPPGVDVLLRGEHGRPFDLLGVHPGPRPDSAVVRAFMPGAEAVAVLLEDQALDMTRVDELGLFAAIVPDRCFRGYRLRVTWPEATLDIDDPYRLASRLGELDRYLLAEGTHHDSYRILGAHPLRHEGLDGTAFAVWAPNARRVSVVGDFNGWDGRRHPMRLHPGCGVWDLFLPAIGPGERYKYEILGADGKRHLKADPCARASELPPANASRVWADGDYRWQDQAWMRERGHHQGLTRPLSIYELHAGSWRRHPDGSWLSYRELADQLVPWISELGFTHIELLPISEHPFSGSWGYQPSGLFAPTSRFGTPDDFRYLVDQCHQAGIGVILDWVPGHFPDDAHGLANFDGTCLYEHADERQGRHRDWDTLIYNLGRTEVVNFLISNALFWLREFHIDGLRIDAVASMLYLDYSREAGDWIPNVHGDNRNLEAIAFFQRLNNTVHRELPDVFTIAEESTAWPQVTQPPEHGGLGFNYKWNMGWMNDSLHYFRHDPLFRSHHHRDLTFGLTYAFSENFVLPLSHDEVVHGKGSLLGQMPGDEWQRLANLRLALAWQWTYPGKKLLFMGAEMAQPAEWDHDGQLDWARLEQAGPAGVRQLLADLNRHYRGVPALHQADCDASGFFWVSCDDHTNNVVVFCRRSHDGELVLVACNFSPVVHHGYRVGAPMAGHWRELLNTDAAVYGGSDVGNLGAVNADDIPCHGQACSLALTLPPLAVVVLAPEAEPGAEPEPPDG
ncbi:MAG: 1,4-alpha-glucan branching protein GlgB [Wenzhouxiangella sp.]|nr:MAG: 1,4-alpha-glucan branching protein GlgB [Wenzhouxiangella sp.]